MKTNQFPKACRKCAVTVPPGAGALVRENGKWVVECLTDPEGCKTRTQKRQEAQDAADALQVGVYVTPTGIYRVQQNKAKTHSYAVVWVDITGARLNLDSEHVHGEWRYAPGAIQNLQPEQQMTLDQAKHFTLVFGQCARCGRKLKAAESVEQGIGPVCRQYFDFGVLAA